MELGELVAVAIPDQEDDFECPFSHEKPNATEKNELGGIGSTLGKNMTDGKGINTSPPPQGIDYTKGSIEKDPRERDHPLRSVQIEVNSQTVCLEDGTPLDYPLTCAAHHLIPAQEALKGHPILQFMCKDGDTQDFRKSSKPDPKTVSGSKVWGNVAYNVNGCHNGVWLPGNYAVGGGRGGIEVWKPIKNKKRKLDEAEVIANWTAALDLDPTDWENTDDVMEEEGPTSPLASAADPKYMLAGKNFNITSANPKWAYVKATMDASDGYFHDRHLDYSKRVKLYLNKIAESYGRRYDKATDTEKPCKKCEEAEKPDGAADNLVGPPYNIVTKLKSASDFFKKHVTGAVIGPNGKPISAKNIYTSKWIKAWMENTAKNRSAQEEN